MTEYLFEYEPGEEEETLTGGEETVPGGGSDTTPGGGNDTTPGGANDDEEEPVVVNTEDNILNPAYVQRVKQSQFGEIYSRLVSDEQESQCAEFLAPQLIKQDRLYDHTSKAAFGSFY